MGGFFLISLLLFTLLSMGGIYLLYQLLVNFQPGKGKINNDLRKLKEEMKPYISELVPWDKEELELLSLNQINTSTKKGFTKTAKGVFTSIYHEPLVAYAYKKYMSSKENAVIYATTSEMEFEYRIREKHTQIRINGQFIGNLANNGALYAGKSNRLLAKINKESEGLHLPILVKDKELAMLVKPENARAVNPRAFELVSPMDKEEEALLLSLSILEMVKKKTNI